MKTQNVKLFSGIYINELQESNDFQGQGIPIIILSNNFDVIN